MTKMLAIMTEKQKIKKNFSFGNLIKIFFIIKIILGSHLTSTRKNLLITTFIALNSSLYEDKTKLQQ